MSSAAQGRGIQNESEEESKLHEFLTEIKKESTKEVPGLPAKPAPAVYFDVVRDDELLGRLDLSGTKQLTFGRDPGRDVILDHLSISRHHATMTFDGSKAFISDFRSTHGTFVATANGQRRLQEKDLVELHSGDVVRFGESSRRYVFNINEPKEAMEPPTKKRKGPHRTAVESALHDGVVDLGSGKIKVTLQAPANVVDQLLSPDGVGSPTLKAIEQRTSARLAFDQPQAPNSMRLVELRGNPNSVAAARLELLTLSNAAQQPFRHERFRYSSTAVPSESLLD